MSKDVIGLIQPIVFKRKSMLFPTKAKSGGQSGGHHQGDCGLLQQADRTLHWGFCFSGKLDVHSPAESQKVSASYSEDAAPFVVGGVGRNYALLRQLDPKNPHYRTVYGVEWWLLEKPRVVYFKTFRLFGPLTARSNSKYILGQTDSMKDFLDTFRSTDWQNKKFDMFGKADSLKLEMLGKINPFEARR